MIEDLIQAVNGLNNDAPRPPVAIAASYRVIDTLKRSPLFIERGGQVALVPSLMPQLIALKNAHMFGLGDELFIVPDHIALKAVIELDDFLSRGSSLKSAVVKHLLQAVREEYQKAWPYRIELLWNQLIPEAMQRENFDRIKSAKEMMDKLECAINWKQSVFYTDDLV